jgi:hypothetical protein
MQVSSRNGKAAQGEQVEEKKRSIEMRYISENASQYQGYRERGWKETG